ncbi:MAG TPA: hypothetical protein DGZ34_06610 [Lachnospiraceae bacterium]|nr:hypothetical protein [Lachnospiraceae bacterium]
MKKRILSIVLTLCMVLMLVPTTAFAEGITPATPQTDTDGVYQIGTAEELYGFAQLVNNGNTSASAVLTADIIVNKGVLKADGTLADDTSGFTSWTPIGNKSNRYTGKFDGQGHTISGLYFNDASTNYVGLFGFLYSGGEIKNVGVIDSYFVGWGQVGGVCGLNDRGAITGCYNTGSVNGSGSNVGGVCGYNAGPITGCYINNGGVYGKNASIVTDCDVKSDEEFANSTVCKLLDTALQNASSDVRFCQRIGKDASPLLTYQFDSIDDHTDDNPKDHICDICGERLSDHTGIDENPKDHLCDICRETLSNHTGGEATCTAKAECEYCGAEYGELDSSNHTGGTEIRGAKDATCTEEGYTGDTYCKGCGAKLSIGTAINMLDHNLEKISAKDATVTETGNTEYWQCKDCGKYFADENGTDEIALDDTVISKLPPEIIEGKGQSITAGEKKELTFKSNAAFSDFIRARLDGKTLDEKNYIVKEGSTIVTLKADYVATLSAGEHTIGIVSESGTATTTFIVNAKAVVGNDTKSPQTGNNSHMTLWIALLFMSGAGVIGTTVYGKKKRAK